jgi:hypothetical protein
MSTDAGSGFDDQAGGRDAGDERLTEERRRQIAEDAGDDDALEEERERKQAEERLNEAF